MDATRKFTWRILRSRLGHLEPEDLADSLVKVIVQVWQTERGREAVVGALERIS